MVKGGVVVEDEMVELVDVRAGCQAVMPTAASWGREVYAPVFT